LWQEGLADEALGRCEQLTDVVQALLELAWLQQGGL
jgi:hypothetical protein